MINRLSIYLKILYTKSSDNVLSFKFETKMVPSSQDINVFFFILQPNKMTIYQNV